MDECSFAVHVEGAEATVASICQTHLTLQKADRPSFSSKQSSHQTKLNKKQTSNRVQAATEVVLVVQFVSRHSCVADRLPVMVRFRTGPRVRLKTVDPPKSHFWDRQAVPK